MALAGKTSSRSKEGLCRPLYCLMSFDNFYPHRKDNRRKYWGLTSKNFDRSCRNHGSCGYCRDTRTYNRRKTLEAAKIQLKLWYLGKL